MRHSTIITIKFDSKMTPNQEQQKMNYMFIGFSSSIKITDMEDSQPNQRIHGQNFKRILNSNEGRRYELSFEYKLNLYRNWRKLYQSLQFSSQTDPLAVAYQILFHLFYISIRFNMFRQMCIPLCKLHSFVGLQNFQYN